MRVIFSSATRFLCCWTPFTPPPPLSRLSGGGLIRTRKLAKARACREPGSKHSGSAAGWIREGGEADSSVLKVPIFSDPEAGPNLEGPVPDEGHVALAVPDPPHGGTGSLNPGKDAFAHESLCSPSSSCRRNSAIAMNVFPS